MREDDALLRIDTGKLTRANACACCNELTPDAVLLVWREVAESGVILRSAVWLRSGDGWRQAFQQGTREA